MWNIGSILHYFSQGHNGIKIRILWIWFASFELMNISLEYTVWGQSQSNITEGTIVEN